MVTTRIRFGATLVLFLTSCAGYTPNPKAVNAHPPSEIVLAHLRACEAGNWEAAASQLGPEYRLKMKGMPFFVSVNREHALDVHKARKRAFPDFRFNETIESRGNAVTVTVFLSGTHTGFLDYPVGGVPKLSPTGKTIRLPSESFTYYVESDRIVYTYGEIPEGHGPPALKKQLGVE